MELIPQEEKISLYEDRRAGTKEIIESLAVIKKTYPALHKGFYDMLDDRIRANNFTAARLKDAINYVIDNCRYPTPTIADFISFDRTVKFKTYDEICWQTHNCPEIWNQWLPVKLPALPKVVWIHANDIVRFKLEKYQVIDKK